MSAAVSSGTTRSTNSLRRVLASDQALRWAVVEELAKRRPEGESHGPRVPSMFSNDLGTRVDNWSSEPGMPLAMGPPDPDALAIENALRELRAIDLDISGYDIGHGLGPRASVDPKGAERFAKDLDRVITTVRERFAGEGMLVAYLTTRAIKNKRPDLGGDVECEPAKGYGGKITLWHTTQVSLGTGPDGQEWFSTQDVPTTPIRAKTYRPGTFCKLNWLRDAADVAEDRAEYAMWHAALTWLWHRLADSDVNGRPVEVPLLRRIKITAPSAPATPWISDPAPPQLRIVPSLLPVLKVGKSRVVAFQPEKRKVEPVRKIDPAEWVALASAA